VAIDVANYVTYADAGRRLGIGRSAVWKLVNCGRLPTVERDGRRYVPVSAVAARLAEKMAKRMRRRERLRGGR
jgi:predicted DNA-binding transcriptional regulator AlpA